MTFHHIHQIQWAVDDLQHQTLALSVSMFENYHVVDLHQMSIFIQAENRFVAGKNRHWQENSKKKEKLIFRPKPFMIEASENPWKHVDQCKILIDHLQIIM